MKSFAKKLIAYMSLVALITVLGSKDKVYAQYGSVIINKRFTIEKEVALVDVGEDEDDVDDWEDKVYIDLNDPDEADQEIIFKIKIKNRSDDDASSFDDMRMEDSLPNELYRIGGNGLTEYWDDFDSGETKTFYIRASIDSDELEREGTFENCVVNKAEVEWDGEFEGSDTATVCYGNVPAKELPKTGANDVLALVGLGLVTLGVLIKRTKE